MDRPEHSSKCLQQIAGALDQQIGAVSDLYRLQRRDRVRTGEPTVLPGQCAAKVS